MDGRSPEQIDRVLGRWQRLLSGLDDHTRLYFYLLRRPASPEAADIAGSGIVAGRSRPPPNLDLHGPTKRLRSRRQRLVSGAANPCRSGPFVLYIRSDPQRICDRLTASVATGY